jgi:hypothetical protein
LLVYLFLAGQVSIRNWRQITGYAFIDKRFAPIAQKSQGFSGEIALFLIQICKIPQLVPPFEAIALHATFFWRSAGELIARNENSYERGLCWLSAASTIS